MELNGWIKLNRSIIDWELFSDPRAVQLWTYLLIRANIKNRLVGGVMVKRGQLSTSQSAIADDLGCERRTVSPILDKLIQAGCVTVRYGKGNRYMIVTICKYNQYQSNLEENTPSQLPSNTPSQLPSNVPLIENRKEEKEEKNNYSLSRACDIDGVTELAVYWNEKVNITTKFVDTNVESNPSRLYRMSDMISVYGMERMKIAIDEVAKNDWLKDNATFDWLTEGNKIERINAGYFNRYLNHYGNNKKSSRLHCKQLTGEARSDF